MRPEKYLDKIGQDTKIKTIKVIKSLEDWDEVKDKFMKLVQDTKIISYDEETYHGKEGVTLVLAGVFGRDGPLLIIFDLRSLANIAEDVVEADQVRPLLPQEFISLLEGDKKVLKIGSGIDNEKSKLNIHPRLDTSNNSKKLMEFAKPDYVSKKTGMGAICKALYGFDCKNLGSQKSSEFYQWKPDLPDDQLAYLRNDLLLPPLLFLETFKMYNECSPEKFTNDAELGKALNVFAQENDVKIRGSWTV